MAPPTLLCIATYFKGTPYLEEAKRQGCTVLLLTAEPLRDEPWPEHAIDETFYLPGQGFDWNRADLFKGAAYVARRRRIDRVVALDDFDLEKAAALREHLRLPGLGETQTRYVRDKLAMREQAARHGVPVPPFTSLFHDADVQRFAETVPAPWVVKPRSQASAAGIRKAHTAEALWHILDDEGDERSFLLAEQFVPGDIFHVDGLVEGGEVVFARAHRYRQPPLAVMQEGGIFASHTVAYGSDEETRLLDLNRQVVRAMGLRRTAVHTEFIRAADGAFYFLETAARVGGAHIADALEASSGLNLWREWARMDVLPPETRYTPPPARHDHAGLIVSLARQPRPDLSGYTDPEIAWRLDRPHHAGLIVRSDRLERVESLLDQYTQRFYRDFHASAPAPDRLA